MESPSNSSGTTCLAPQPSTLHPEGEGKDGNGDYLGEDISFWSPYKLTFQDEALEKWFSGNRLAEWVESDPIHHSMLIVPILLTLVVAWSALTLVLKIALIATAVVQYLLSLWSSQPSYLPKRHMVVSACRIWLVFLSANVSLSGISNLRGIVPLLGRLVIWGPLSPLLALSVNFQVPFHIHFPVQLLAVAASLFWVHYICANAVFFGSTFGTIADCLNNLMASIYITSPFETHGIVKMPSEAVIIFALFLFGMVLPSTLVFAAEAYTRAEFCLKVASSRYHKSIQSYLWDSLKFCSWAAFFSLQILWMLVFFLGDS